MRLLLFSDLHCDVSAAERLCDLSASVDVVVGAGDFATLRRGLPQVISVLADIAVPMVFVAGNSETPDELQQACAGLENVCCLHGTQADVAGVSFFGLGGAVPVTPFGDWSFDLTEAEAAALLEGCPGNTVLVSHSPPAGLLDVSSRGESLGSTSVAACIRDRQPRLVVCGHIHESGGKTGRIGDVPVVNAGPGGIAWDLSRDCRIDLPCE